MEEGLFKYEDCPLKHHIRKEAWLPLCKNRKRLLRQGRTKAARDRRLHYFTFCAVGAIDVLMLDVEKVIRPSNDRFDTVCFFDVNEEYVNETQKSIPGAIGFPGDFVEIVCADDPEEGNLIDDLAALTSATDAQDTLATRKQQACLAKRRQFILQFPFDVINFDLEGFLFQPNTPPPGRLMRAFRKVFEWQRRPLRIGTSQFTLDGFSLMLTTQIGPPNLPQDYRDELRRYLEENLDNDAELRPLLLNRTGVDNPTTLSANYFEDFFRLSTPKALANVLMAEDWYVDPDTGISLYEIERAWEGGKYRMLHLLMDIKRQNPDRDHRFAGPPPVNLLDAYRTVVRAIFERRETAVTDALIDRPAIDSHLNLIRARRAKYLGEN